MVRLVLEILRQRVKQSMTLTQRVGLLGTHAFLCPHLFITGNRPHSASLNSNRQVQTVDNYGRGDGRQGKNSQETIVQLCDRVMVPLQETYITIPLSCFMNTETQTRWEKLTVFCPQALRRPDWLELMMLTPNYLTTNQSEECPLVDHALFEPLL